MTAAWRSRRMPQRSGKRMAGCAKRWPRLKAAMETELGRGDLATPCRKALESLQEHWGGLTRFVDDPRIPKDNNASERRARGPAVARKNFYGSGLALGGPQGGGVVSVFGPV